MIATLTALCRSALLTAGLVGTSALAVGQDEATTLSRLIDGSDAVVVARVHRITGNDPLRTGRQFVREEVLRGDAPSAFVLDEPAAAGCGRALRGLLPGQRVILFLSRRAGGDLMLRTSGARAVPLASQGLRGHVRALIGTTDAVGRARIAVASLDHPVDRVRRDAALDLPYLPALGAAAPSLTSRIARAIDRRDPTLPSLVLAAARLDDRTAISALLPAYLDAESAPAQVDLTGFLRRSLLQFDHGAVARHVAGRAVSRSTAQHRAVALLGELDTAEAQPVLSALLRTTTTRSVAIAAARALLDAGVHDASVATLTHPTVMEAARRSPRTRRFRSVLRTPSGGQR